MDDGDGYYLKDDVRLADGRSGGEAAWALGGAAPPLACSARSTRSIPGDGVLFGRSGWIGQHAIGHHLGRRPGLRLLVAAGARRRDALGRGQRHLQLVARRRRLPGPPAGRALPARAARPLAAVRLLHAADAGALADGAGAVDTTASAWSTPTAAYVLLHEQLVPYVRAAAATAARTGLPIIRPLCLIDPERPARLGADRRLRLRPGAVGRAGARRRRARARGSAAARASGSRPGRAERVDGGGEVVAAGAARADPGLGARRARSSSPIRRTMSRAGSATRPSPSGRWWRRCGASPRSGTPARLADGTRIAWRRGRVVGITTSGM